MANQSIGGIAVDFEANTVNFIRGLDRATDALNRQNKQFSGLMAGARNLRSALGALGIAFGATQLLSFGRQALDAAGGLGELSDQLGISTDLYQSLEYAASQSGVKTADFETAVRTLTRTLGDAQAGQDTAVDAFERAGISLEKQGGAAITTEDALRALAEATKNASSEAEAASIAADLLGAKVGGKLLPMLQNGEAGLEAFIVRARELGLVFDEDMIAAADEASDSWTELEMRLTKAGQALAVEVIPPMLDFLDAAEQWRVDTLMDEWRGDLEVAIAQVIRLREVTSPEFALTVAQEQLDAALAKLNLIEAAQHRISGPDVMGGTPNTPSGPVSTLPIPGMKDSEAETDFARDQADATREAAQQSADAISRVVDALEFERDQLSRTALEQEIYNNLKQAGTDATTVYGQQIVALTTEINELTAADEAHIEASRVGNDLRMEAAKIIEDLRSPLDVYTEQVNRLDLMQQRGLLTEREWILAKSEAREELEKNSGVLEEQERIIADHQDMMRDAAEVGKEWGSTLADVALGYEDLKDVGKKALQQLIQFLWDAIFATNELGSSTGGLAGLLESVFGGGKTGKGGGIGGMFLSAAFSSIGSLFGGGGSGAVGGSPAGGGFLTFGGPRAAGGDVSPGMAYMVGERGPEPFVPDSAGTIIPNGWGGGSTTYIIDARGAEVGVVDRLMRAMKQLDRSIEPRAAAKVLDSRQRGGAFGTQFRGK